MDKITDPNLAIPKGLSRGGRKAAKTILESGLKELGSLSSGGCRTFYTPKEWADRGEVSGNGSILVVVYDGGDLYSLLSYHSESPRMRDRMDEAMDNAGFFIETINCWSSAVYLKE